MEQLEKEYATISGGENAEGNPEDKKKPSEAQDKLEADKENLLHPKTSIPIMNKIGIKDEY